MHNKSLKIVFRLGENYISHRTYRCSENATPDIIEKDYQEWRKEKLEYLQSKLNESKESGGWKTFDDYMKHI